ncbi:PhzF family phenazine biosynthesis protein [Rugamonas rivuli]|uniref:PhzF family phenazine biosynthesis isomerase n=1 Tax=Rugamonas rivuli TaxID=2743358 RepID=A0A843SLX7_9BURK|nr:PhzF family phenazine biosynthesis protein [Rugamonas rivuli]MQA23040.1 PhzF family phenazine biosynthesis isomerase [Rugamonas rivuli]
MMNPGPLAVVENADGLGDDVLRRIAGEFNQAETTFLMRSERADWKLRSFTASGAEVGGAGHNALGAWLWLGHHGALGPLDTPATFHQEIGGEVLPITLERRDGRIYGRMRQAPLKLGAPLSSPDGLAAALGVGIDQVQAYPPPRAADTGAPHLMVRLQDRAAVDRVRPSAQQLLAVLGPAGAEGCYVYAFDEAAPATAYARFFNPTVGLWEDSATGTAAGPLTAYLGEQSLLAEHRSLVIEQGRQMGRPSLLHVRLAPDAELSGTGIVVLRGVLKI